MKGSVIPEEGDDELFLVDFEKKSHQKRHEDEEEDEYRIRSNEKYVKIGFDYNNPSDKKYYDAKKSSKHSSDGTEEDQYKELLHEKWESERIANAEKMTVHYHDIKYDEARELGVGHFKFSSQGEERKNQMKYFHELEKEANRGRLNIQQEKKTRDYLLKERLRKVRQKRLLKEGYSLEDIENVFRVEDEAELERVETEAKLLQDKELEEQEEKSKIDERKKSLPVLDREWDKPKLKEPVWNKMVENMRQERVTDFAPPQIYEPKEKKNKMKNKTPEVVKDNTTDFVNKQFSRSPPPSNFMIPPPNFMVPPPPPNFMVPPPNFMMFPPPLPFQMQNEFIPNNVPNHP